MQRFILTGGIGTGKSLASTYFQKLNVGVIDTDDISRLIMKKSSLAVSRLQEIFGDEILLYDQEINKDYLRELIFNDINNKSIIESILHPLIQQYTIQTAQILECQNPQLYYIIYAVPLFLGKNKLFWQQQTNGVIAMYSNYENRLKRILKRGLSIEMVDKIINSQPDNQDYIKNSIYNIENNKTAQHLFNKINELHLKLR